MVRTNFETLDFVAKQEYLFRNGQVIGRRFYNDNLYLFLVEDFFVEVSLNDSENHFERIEIVNYDVIQNYYLHLIDISDVFKVK
jgi:hypothetical protein